MNRITYMLMIMLTSTASIAGWPTARPTAADAANVDFVESSQQEERQDVEVKFSLASYNLFFLPFQGVGRALNATYLMPIVSRFAKAENLDSKALARAEVMSKELPALADIFAFQEAFDWQARETLKQGMKEMGVHYATDDLERSFFQSGRRFAGSGLLIMSKYPITEQSGIYFQDEFVNKFGEKRPGIVPFNADTQADKGVLYAKIRKDGLSIHVFTTHTQAKSHYGKGENKKPIGINIRKAQFERLVEFIESKHIPENEPVIIAGDMNVACRGRSYEFDSMKETLNAEVLPIAGEQKNTTLHVPLYEDRVSKREGDQIDYIFCYKPNLSPKESRSYVREDVRQSDHFPLVAEFTFNATKEGAQAEEDLGEEWVIVGSRGTLEE